MEINWARFWHSYSKTTVTGITWRLATPDDMGSIRRIRGISERLRGVPQRKPNLFEKPVLLALVAENEHGRIIDAVYVEMQVEVVKIGLSASGMIESAAIEPDLTQWLRDLNFRTVLVTTPPTLKERMGNFLKVLGFRSSEGKLTYWRRAL